MRSKYIDSTSGCKCLAENGFSNIDFLYDVEILASRRRFPPNYGDFSLRMRSFDHIATFGLNSDVIFEFSAPVFLKRRGHFGHATPFSAIFVTIMCVCAVSTLIRSILIHATPSISYITGEVSPFDAAFRLFWRMFTAYASFDHITTLGL